MLSQNFTPVVSARNLGVTFDNNLNSRQHILQTYRCFYYFCDLRPIRRYMHFALAKTSVTALVNSKVAITFIIILLSMTIETSTYVKCFDKGS